MIKNLLRQSSKYTHKHSPFIMTMAGIIGVGVTSYLTAQASFKAARAIDEAEATGGISDDPVQRLKEQTQLTWRFYIPPVTAGVVSVGAIAYANRLGNRRTAAAISAYTVIDQAFNQYQNKVREEIGAHKEQVLRDDIARDRVAANDPSNLVIIGTGESLCCELLTGRYFMSDMETLRKAQNDINARVVSDLYVSLDEFYYLVGLKPTAHSAELGWDSDRLMELEFSSVLSPEGKPCIAFNFNYTKPI